MAWMRIDRVSWTERALWAALVGGSVAPLALRPGPEDVARAYVAAVNRGDVEAAMGLTGEDFVMRPHMSGYSYGRESARDVLEWRAALHESWRVVSWDYDPVLREVDAVVEISNDAWRLVGARPEVEVVLVVRNGRLDLETARRESGELRWAVQGFIDWVSANRPRELARVWRNGHLLRRGDAARALVRLLEAWRAAEAPVAAAPERAQP
ncbi:MAG TPA: hypothetical protein VIE68_06755 [Gemmatimonadota bacterium]|jgi:hypothetical protein